MAEIIESYRQEVGAFRFIGKRYGDADRVDGGFGKQWDMFFENNWLNILEKLVDDPKKVYEDGDAYIGLMRCKKGEPCQYWIGMFMPPGTEAPEGFEYVDLDAGSLGVCWLYGPENSVFGQEDKCAQKLKEDGFEIIADKEDAFWFFERYCCPRFTTPDDKGNIILDICHYIK